MVEPNDLVANRYLLEEHVASGTMGEVWRGTDTRLKRTVAVKLLHPELSEAESARARFEAEATVVAALNSPQIASVHDYGEEPDGESVRSYLVMEWIEGRSLAELLRQSGKLSVADTVHIVTEAAEALHAAHVAGIVHRDVKPANILITHGGEVRLIDFGIASVRDETGRDESGNILGTLAYLSPEQITNWRLTPGVDVYALGIVAYECLTGAPPFGTDNPAETLAGHLSRPPQPLPSHIPEPVAEAIAKAVRKRATNRWLSAAEFASALREAAAEPRPVAAVTVSAPPVSVPPRPTRHRRRLAVQLVGMFTVIAMLSVAGLVLWPSLFPARPDHDTVGESRAADTGGDGGSGGSSSPTGDESGKATKEANKPGDPGKATSEDDEPGDDPTSGDDNDDDNDGGSGGSGQTVPNLKGTQTYAVAYVLKQHGFERSAGKAQTEKPGETNCVVIGQSPSAGTKASPATTIVYYYRAPTYGCGGGSRISAMDSRSSKATCVTMMLRHVSRRGLRGDRPRIGGEPVSHVGAHRLWIDGRSMAW